MMGPVLSVLTSHWRRNPLQLVTLLVGLALATGLWSGVQAINAEARASYRSAAALLNDTNQTQITARDKSVIAVSDYVALRRAGWPVTPILEGHFGNIWLLGIDPLTTNLARDHIIDLAAADIADFLLAPGMIFGRQEVLARLQGATNAQLMPRPQMAPNTAVMDLSVAQRLLPDRKGLSRLLVTGPMPTGQPSLEDLAPHLRLILPQTTTDIARLTDSFHLNLTAFGLLAFAVGIFVVHGAIGLAFEQRRGTITTLRALGVSLRHLIAVQALELLCWAFIAGGLGLCAGYVMAAALLPDVATTLRGLYGAEVSESLHLRPSWWLSGFAMALLGAGIAAITAFWQVTQMPLLAAAQPRAWALASRRLALWQAFVALGLLGTALALAHFGTGLMSGFALLAALLFGAALALPLLLDQSLAGLGRCGRTALVGWFWADTRQQVPGLSLALMALLLALAANIGVSTMVSSFRQTFIGFLDQRLAAELYVSVENPAQASAVRRYLQGRVEAVLPVQSVVREVKGAAVEIFGNHPHKTYRDNWRFLDAVPNVWQQLEAGKALIVNEQLYRLAKLELGQLVQIAPNFVLPVAGFYGDYGNPMGQIVVTERVFQRLYPKIVAQRFGLRLVADQVAVLQQDLAIEFDLSADNMVDQARLKELSLEVFERTFAVTSALNTLTLSVAAFAILMSLLTLSGLRLPQLAPVWALGLTRRELAGFEVVRAMFLAAFTALLALVLGLLLAWVLLAVINVEAFGWRLPMRIFPLEYLKLALLALLAALLAALWPAWHLARRPPTDLLQVFSNER